MLGAVLRHLLCELVVHVFLDTHRCFFFLRGIAPNNFSLNRTCCWECLHDGLRLKPNNGFSNHRVKHSTRAVPRLCSFFELQAEKRNAVLIHRLPVFTARDVVVDVARQITCQTLKRALIHLFGEVGVKLFFGFFFSKRKYGFAVYANSH